MKVKLTKKSMWALTDIVTEAVRGLAPHSTADILVLESLERLMYDLQKRCILVKGQYSMQWHPERCIAFHAAFEAFLPPPVALAIAARNEYHCAEQFAHNLVRSLMGQIHQQYIVKFFNRTNTNDHENDQENGDSRYPPKCGGSPGPVRYQLQ